MTVLGATIQGSFLIYVTTIYFSTNFGDLIFLYFTSLITTEILNTLTKVSMCALMLDFKPL